MYAYFARPPKQKSHAFFYMPTCTQSTCLYGVNVYMHAKHIVCSLLQPWTPQVFWKLSPSLAMNLVEKLLSITIEGTLDMTAYTFDKIYAQAFDFDHASATNWHC